jgi:hypothetical protein
MTRIILTIVVLLTMGNVTVNAAAMVTKSAEKPASTVKVKKRGGFKKLLAKSASFVASSAVNGTTLDR